MSTRAEQQQQLIRAVTDYIDHTAEAMRTGDRDAVHAACHNFPTEAVPTLVMLAATNRSLMADLAAELDVQREQQ